MRFEDLTAVDDVTTTETGERLLSTASQLFFARGLTATGVDLIADTAGTTKRTLYQRYGSKDGLTAAYLRRRAHRWQTELLRRLEAGAPQTPDEALGLVFSAAEEWAADARRGCAFVNAWAELGPADSESTRIIREEKAWMRELFRLIAQDDIAATTVHQLYEGAQVCAALLGDHEAFDTAASAASAAIAGSGSRR